MSEITQQKATPHSSGKRMAQPGQTPPCERVFRLPHHMEVRAAHCSAACTRQTPGLNHAPAKQSRHLRLLAAHQRRLRRKTSQTKCAPGRTAQAETTPTACCSGEGGKTIPTHSTNQAHAPQARMNASRLENYTAHQNTKHDLAQNQSPAIDFKPLWLQTTPTGHSKPTTLAESDTTPLDAERCTIKSADTADVVHMPCPRQPSPPKPSHGCTPTATPMFPILAAQGERLGRLRLCKANPGAAIWLQTSQRT